MSSPVTSAGSIRLRLIELGAELQARLGLLKTMPRIALLEPERTRQIHECQVIEAKVKALQQALADCEAAR